MYPWIKNQELVPDNVLGYVLSENYGSDISIQKLHGHDRLVVNQLKEECEKTNFDVYLSVLENRAGGRSQQRYDGWGGRYSYDDDSEDYEMAELEEESWHLTMLKNLEGEKIREDGISFDMGNLVNDDPFVDDAITDHEDADDRWVTKYYRAAVSLHIDYKESNG